jgi:transcriptional regulator with XRE-family HTH domain
MPSSAATWLQNIAANVRRLRLRHGWTQEELAERAKIEPRYVHSVEAARANPTVRVLVALSRELEVDPPALFRPAKFSKQRPGRPVARR